jgi:hypothetical protein
VPNYREQAYLDLFTEMPPHERGDWVQDLVHSSLREGLGPDFWWHCLLELELESLDPICRARLQALATEDWAWLAHIDSGDLTASRAPR